MNAHIYQELQNLTAAEKHALGEALIVSADTQATSLPITQAQSIELKKRLAHHRASPNEPGLNFAQLKIKLVGRSIKYGL
jgi:putative addiction module component (TIGR02574 family)